MGALPERTVEYNGRLTQSHRWADFRHRPDDIFICTPPKNGTTWTQAICAMLVFGRADIDQQPGNISPWYDSIFHTPEATNSLLEAQKHRRFIKTHTPLDGLPFFPECTYFAVYRDPRDAFLSMANHLENMADPSRPPLPEDQRAAFTLWCTNPLEKGRTEYQALASPLNHLNTFWRWRHLPNVHLFHYADMKRDRIAAVRAMAQALGITLADATYAAIAEATSFEAMRAKADQFAPDSGQGVWKSETEFFNKGRQGQWREFLGPRELEVYREAVAAALPPDAAAWLENGGAVKS
ncbi:MAG TPA: sulfotransferase domain-containing protein [Rhizomicrobium sp.]|jgi:hypothetical protein